MNADATDLFGAPVVVRGPKYTPRRGYAGLPGTGPAGETCATCKHADRYGRYAKCGHPVRRGRQTHGYATDILLRTPACLRWEATPAGLETSTTQ